MENKDYMLIEKIQGNEDLHDIARKIKFEDGATFLPKNTTRQQFLNEIIEDIQWKMDMVNPGMSKSLLFEEYKKALNIKEKEEKHKKKYKLER